VSSLESKIQADFLKWIEKQVGVWIVKYPGGIFGKTGTPDVILCVQGKFVAIEMKKLDGYRRKMQEYQQKKIRSSGGICEFCDTLESAKELVISVMEGSYVCVR
jgi:hypothetical protein